MINKVRVWTNQWFILKICHPWFRPSLLKTQKHLLTRPCKMMIALQFWSGVFREGVPSPNLSETLSCVYEHIRARKRRYFYDSLPLFRNRPQILLKRRQTEREKRRSAVMTSSCGNGRPARRKSKGNAFVTSQSCDPRGLRTQRKSLRPLTTIQLTPMLLCNCSLVEHFISFNINE